ncbi:MAG: phosphate transport system regulatory protein PhoU [Clostridiales bacterium GWF2_36_10]|nr:MAG: phosphate transport system regulatory protein PhoU [Clostridiales bacterium GWF2_36_10]HAN22080.1 phosphate transport system regulatory protein PhoU [Clostridiales bacterium]
MRNKFDLQLEELNNDLISMGALCETAIANAVKALNNNDMILAEKAIITEKEIDQKEKDIETLCLKLLLQQQPVAKDLRLISSALKMITDMERIGDQAADIAEIVTFIDLSESKNNVHISDMAEATRKMVTESIDAFVKRDLGLAHSVIGYDDVVDNLFTTIKKDLIELIASDIKYGEQALDILMIAKYLERIGDHAVNIAEWVVFAITGTHKE